MISPLSFKPFIFPMCHNGLYATAVLLVVACGEHTHEHDEENPAEHACVHMTETPNIVAAASSNGEAANISAEHTHYQVNLIDVDGGKGGVIKFTADEANDFIVFLGTDITLKMLTPTGIETVAEKSVTMVQDCDSIKAYHIFALEAGIHYLHFGPTMESTVNLTVEEALHGH